jgi:MFS family permease
VSRRRRSPTLLSGVLVFVTTVAAVISSLGAPLIPSISRDLHIPLSTAQWSLTAALLAGAVSAPIMGRLGDGPHRRQTLLAGLAIVTLGGALSALATGLPLLVAGRTMQGLGLGLVPLTMAAARDHLPRERVAPAIALLSVAAAAGVGLGYPLSGLIADVLGLSAAFWFGAVVSGAALLAALAVVPHSSTTDETPLDVPGAVLLAVALIALLLGIAEGKTWGWSSPTIVALFAGAIVVFAVWTRHQLRTPTPLVELKLLRHPAVLTGDVCATVLGVAMYMYLSLVTEFVQTPTATGYGFGASVVVAGLCLVPFSVLSLASARLLPWLGRTIGERAILPLGCLVVAAAGVFFAVAHGALWAAFVTMSIVGIGMGTTFAAIPGMVVRSVPDSETGSAMGFYQVVRYVGFSLGSALAASILAAHTPAGAHLPAVGGYTTAMWIAIGICLVAGALAWFLPERGARRAAGALGEEDAELGTAGLVGIERP